MNAHAPGRPAPTKWVYSDGRWTNNEFRARPFGETPTWRYGEGAFAYWAGPDRELKVLRLKTGVSYDERDATVHDTLNGELVAGFQCADLLELVIDVTPGENTVITLGGWAAELPAEVAMIALQVGTAELTFTRDEHFSVRCGAAPKPGDPVRLDDWSIPVQWRWRPAIGDWAIVRADGDLTVSRDVKPGDAGRAAILLLQPPPPGAQVEAHGSVWALEELGLPKRHSAGACYVLIQTDDTGYLQWTDFIRYLRAVPSIHFSASGYEPFAYDTRPMVQQILQQTPYQQGILLEGGRVKFEVHGDSAYGFGPSAPVFPGTIAVAVRVIDPDSQTDVPGAGTLGERRLPVDWETGSALDVYLRQADAKYGVYAQRATIPHGRWLRAASLCVRGLVSWQGLVDEFEIKRLAAPTSEFEASAQRLSLHFVHGFDLHEAFCFFAPFGGVGMVQGQASWGALAGLASGGVLSRIEKPDGNAIWRIKGSYWQLLEARDAWQAMPAGRTDPPFTIALASTRLGGASGPILEVSVGAAFPRLIGFLSTTDGRVNSMGTPTLLMDQAAAPVTLEPGQAIEELPTAFQAAARAARDDLDNPDGQCDGISWERYKLTLAFSMAANAPTEDSGIYVFEPTTNKEVG